jgi:hypothetical protein
LNPANHSKEADFTACDVLIFGTLGCEGHHFCGFLQIPSSWRPFKPVNEMESDASFTPLTAGKIWFLSFHSVLLAFGALAQFFRSGGQYFCKSNFRPMSQKFRYIYS